MKIKSLRTIAGSYGVLPEGVEAVVSDSVGKDLIDAGLAVEVKEADKEEPKEEKKKKR